MVSTVNVTPLLAAPATVTTTDPVVAPAGTGTAILVALQLVGVAAVPLKVTVLLPASHRTSCLRSLLRYQLRETWARGCLSSA